MRRHIGRGLSVINNGITHVYDKIFLKDPLKKPTKREIHGGPRVFIHKYHLVVDGNVRKKLALEYEDLRRMDPEMIEHKKKRWVGIGPDALMEASGARKSAKEIAFWSADGTCEKHSIDEVSKKGLLAYNVDNKPISKKEGFPLCLLFEGQKMGWIERVEII